MEDNLSESFKNLSQRAVSRKEFITVCMAMIFALLGVETVIKRLQGIAKPAAFAGFNTNPDNPSSKAAFAATPSVSKKPIPTLTDFSDYNVLIVGYDTVGAKHVSSLGYDRDTTPMLDKIASEGFSFTQNISPAPWTVPSFMSLFTDLYPTEHKVVNKYTVYTPELQVVTNLDEVSPGTKTLAEEFKAAGYLTAGFTGDAGVGGQFGDKDGFGVYYDKTTFGSIATSGALALNWLKANPNQKFFMFLHGYDAHGQFQTPPNYNKTGMFVPRNYTGKYNGTPAEEAQLRELQLTQKLDLSPADVAFWTGIYDSKIRDLDDRFANFWSQFSAMGLDKNTIVIMMADHGEEIYEHGGIDHGHTLYDELMHVPLVIKIPGMGPAAPFTQQVTSLDVAPTIFDLIGFKPDSKYRSQLRGTSLLPLLQGKTLPTQDVYMETDYRDWTHKRGIRTSQGWKYVITEQTRIPELYNLEKDPGEHDNVIKGNPLVASILSRKVRDHIINMGDDPDKVWTVGCSPVYADECIF